MTSTVTLRFTTHWPPNPTSLVLAWLGQSRDWSHCMILLDGLAYEAKMLEGCRAVPVDVAMQGAYKYQDMQIPVADLDGLRAFGKAQVGKGYDFAGVLGLPLLHSTDWADESRWWCSELNFMMLGKGGNFLFDPAEKTRVTPNDLHMTDYAKSNIIFL